jgi:AcrR family transcriptional regulator
MPRAKQRTPQLRDHVLSIAVDVLSREGAAGFTTRTIAREAQTSTPAVYELFGDKSGLVREVFFEGFRLLRHEFEGLAATDEPREDLLLLIGVYRRFVIDNPMLAQVMFSRPFADFEPGPAELRAGSFVQKFIIDRVCRCIEADLIVGDAADVAHVLVALARGLAASESADLLGSSQESIDRRWALATQAVLDGLGSGRQRAGTGVTAAAAAGSAPRYAPGGPRR